MYKQTSNKRAASSLEMLSTALLLILEEQDIESVKIRSLCRKAGISPKTYYRNCLVLTDLIRYQCDLRIRGLFQTVDWAERSSRVLFDNFFSYWKSHLDFLTLLHRRHLFWVFEESFVQRCLQETTYPTLENFLSRCDPVQQESYRVCHHTAMSGQLCALLSLWAQRREPVSEKQLTDTMVFFTQMLDYL